jgi:predicted small lipoprotein YifL
MMAAVAAALAFGLAACGKKGPLDPPPSASISQPQTAGEASAEPAQPSGPTPRRERIFLDWLLD